MKVRVYGLVLELAAEPRGGSLLDSLRRRLPAAPQEAAVDLVLAPLAAEETPGLGEPIYASPTLLPDGRSALEVRRARTTAGSGDELDFDYGPAGLLRCGRRRIAFRLPSEGDGNRLEIHLLGTVLPYWLERQCGSLALHGAVAEIDRRAVALLGAGGVGKSTLLTALLAAGGRLLSDDLAIVDPATARVQPAYPEMRRWPEAGAAEGLERVVPELDKRRVPVAPASFCAEATRLALIVLPRRTVGDAAGENSVETADLTWHRLTRPGAVVELLRHSRVARLMAALGRTEERLDRLARLLERVEVRRLEYPSGRRHLAAVTAAIAAETTSV